MKMRNMGNNIVDYRYSSVAGVNWFLMVGVARGLIPVQNSVINIPSSQSLENDVMYSGKTKFYLFVHVA